MKSDIKAVLLAVVATVVGGLILQRMQQGSKWDKF